VIAKGNLHGDGGKLARYLMTGEGGERIEFVEARGLDNFGPDPAAAFETLQQFADTHTRSTKPFFHTQTRLAPGEQLAPEQWMEIADREERRLGFAGQPRIVTFHIHGDGERHMHIGWCRIDLETERAIDPGMYKNHLKQLARDFEREFDLRELDGTRKPEDRAKAPGRAEEEESRRLGTDVRKIRTTILDCLERADGGKGFKAALEERGFVLANGDRRDCFVVIDQAGGHHALNKKLTGLTLAAMRDRMSDLDRSQLPGVEQAKAMQAERQAAPELHQTAAQEQDTNAARDRYGVLDKAARHAETERDFSAGSDRVTEPATPNYDRDADNRAWEDRVIDAAIAGTQEALQPGEPGRGGEKDPSPARGRTEDQAPPEPAPEQQQERPLGQTAGDLRMAWATSRSVGELEEALAARGISLAEVSAEEARASERTSAFAKEVGNFARVLTEGEIVAVNRHGDTYRLDQRTTGDAAPDIEAHLAGLDRASLMSVADTAEVMQEAARENWKDEQRASREQARPASDIEKTIADALIGTISGEELAAKLEEAGVTVARATDRDVAAFEALREEAALDATVAFAEDGAAKRGIYPNFMPGDFAAVTAGGAVFRLNPDKLDLEDLEKRLAEVEPKGLPSITEARAQSEIDREETAKFRADARAQNAEARAASNDAFDGERAFRSHAAAAEHGVESAIHAADDAMDAGMHAATRGMSGFATAVEKALSGIFSFFGLGEPKLTPMQRELAAKAEDELAEARAWQAAQRQKDAEQDWQIFEQDRRQQQDEHERDLGYRERPGDRERERERY
jgi:Relaxase/Mobilisation nuclease domain